MGESPCSFPSYVVVDQLVIVRVEVRVFPCGFIEAMAAGSAA